MHKSRQSSTARMLYPIDLSAPGAVEALLAAHRATFGGYTMVDPAPVEIPADVTTVEDLEAAVTEAVAESERINSREDLTDEELDRLEALADFVDACRAEAAAREESAEERRTRAEAARLRIAGEADADAGDGEDDNADAAGVDAAEGAAAEGDQPEGEQDGEQEQEQAVAAGGGVRRRRAPSLVRRMERPDNPAPEGQGSQGQVTITAAAGIRNVEPGARIPSMERLAEAFTQKLSGFPQNLIPGQYLKSPVASLSVGGWGDLDQGKKVYEDDQELITAAGNERRLKGADGRTGLAASGGWCAPSQTLYDFLSPFTTEGMLDIAEFRVTRGGVNTTIGPDWSALFANADADFVQTEAQAETGDTKPCVEVDCPPFAETRLDATGYCVKSPILTQVGYPELVRDFLAGVAVGHQLKVSARTIASIVADLPAAATVPASGSAARSVLTSLELVCEGERQKQQLALDETLEVIIPAWVEVVLRDDFAHRNALNTQDARVTDALIAQHFADRGIRPQWVRGWQPLTVPATGVINFPDTVNVIGYPAGTFVRGRQDVISLDAVYDTTNLSTNMYTAAFFEEAMLVLRRGRGGFNLNIPLVTKGSTGPQDLVAYS